MATGSCWRPASPPGLTGAPGSAPSKLGALGGAKLEPRRPLNHSGRQSLLPPRWKNRLICPDATETLFFPAPSPQPSASRGGRRRSGGGERKKAQARGTGGLRGRGRGRARGDVSSRASPSNGSGKCDLPCIPGAVPWGDLSQPAWAGGADKEARQAERTPRGGRRGAGGGGSTGKGGG